MVSYAVIEGILILATLSFGVRGFRKNTSRSSSFFFLLGVLSGGTVGFGVMFWLIYSGSSSLLLVSQIITWISVACVIVTSIPLVWMVGKRVSKKVDVNYNDSSDTVNNVE